MPKSAAERQYNVRARWYDLIWSRYSQRTASAILSRVDVGAQDIVLDVGCGTGAIEKQILNKDPLQSIVGVDLSEKMLRRARANAWGRNARYVRASASDLPFEDGSFDLVLSASALHYILEPEAALAEMGRVLKPGGRMAILDWCCNTKVMQLRDAVLRAIDPAHVRTYTEEEARAMFAAAGLTVGRSRTLATGTYHLMVLEARPA